MRGSGQLKAMILGGTSKVWRLVAPFWTNASAGIETLVAARSPGDGIDVTLDAFGDLEPDFDAVIALWGVTSGNQERLAGNRKLAKQATQIAKDVGARVVFQASTGAVYEPSHRPLSETSKIAPRSAYGKSKADAEKAARTDKVKSVFLRLGNVAGADALAHAARGQDIVILDQWPDGNSPQRSYISPRDLASILADLVSKAPQDLPSEINIAGPVPVEMKDILRAARLNHAFRPARSDALPLQHLATQRLSALGISCPASSNPAHLSEFLLADAL